MPDFLLYALSAGAILALAAGPLGVCLVWQRMAYFGESMAHASLLGVAVGLALGVDVRLGIVLAALAAAA